MKKTLTVIATIGLAVSAFAQGTVDFNNKQLSWQTGTTAATFGNVPTEPDRLVYGAGGVRLSGTNWAVALYFAPGVVTNQNALTTAATTGVQRLFRQPTSAYIGTWSGGTATLAGVDKGQTATLQVRIWDYSKFTTFEAAVAAGLAGQEKIGRAHV